MNSLLDFIFDNLNIEELDREGVRNHTCYLNEIVPQLSTDELKIKFLRTKVRLDKRLIELDKQLFNT